MRRYKMDKEAIYSAANEKFEEIRELALELHAMVHPAEVSGGTEKTIADFVLDYMMQGKQNELVPRETWDTDLHYAGQRPCRFAGRSGISTGSRTLSATF